jgi:GTPase
MVRLTEGFGEALYEIGVSDNGTLVGIPPNELLESIDTLRAMGKMLNADVSIVRIRNVAEDRQAAELLVRKGLTDDEHFLEIRISMVGGLGTGKSTLLGVLATGEFDNGRGKARLNLLRHRHEIESGRTSSISHQIIGFTPQGDLVNFSNSSIHSWEQVCEASSKVVTFLDTCGHPKYQRTTLHGITGRSADYACLILDAKASGLCDESVEHLNVLVLMKVPIFVVVTKIDVATSSPLTKTLSALFQMLKSPGIKKIPMIMETEDDVVLAISHLLSST